MVNNITKTLFKKYNTLEKFAEADVYQLEKEIKSIGFYRIKARNIIETAKILLNDYNGIVPNSIENLIKLKGVGRKTANVILANVYNIPSIIVDTHCLRLSNRFGLCNSRDPDKVEEQLRLIISNSYYTIYSNLTVYHGREICHAKKPKCSVCCLNDICEYYINSVISQ